MKPSEVFSEPFNFFKFNFLNIGYAKYPIIVRGLVEIRNS